MGLINRNPRSYSPGASGPPTTNMEFWFDADSSYITKDGGDLVSQWDDRSGNARHLAQATGTKQPLWISSAQNSLPGVRFDGTSDSMAAANFTFNQPETVYIVFKQIGWTNLCDVFDGSAMNNMRLYQKTASPRLGTYAGAYGPDTTSLAVGTHGLTTAIFNGASSELRINAGTAQTGNVGANNGGGLTVGSHVGGAGFFSNIEVCEIIGYSSAHDSTAQGQVQDYLNDKYDIFGNDSYTKLLVHCNGADASTSFTDVSGSAHTITANGNAQVDTAQKKFGTGAALFGGATDYLSVPTSSDWHFGSGDFTVDFWLRFSATTDTQMIYTQRDTGDTQDSHRIFYSSSVLYFGYSTNGSAFTNLSVAWTPSIDTWYHVAVTRHGNNLRFFVDGTQVGSTKTLSATIWNSTSTLTIGGNQDYSYSVKGWLDEFRISKGIARWTANFTPPTGEYD